MKRIASVLVLLALMLPALPAAYAQETPGAWHLGLRGGLSSADLRGNDADSEFRTGFSGGVFATYDVNSAFSVQPEVLYTTKGGNNVGALRSTVRYDYLEVPILFKLSAPLKPVTPRLYAGPGVGFLLNAELSGRDISDDIRSVDVGGIVGGELAVDLSRFGRLFNEIALDGRYNIGLRSVDDVSDADVFNNNFAGKLSLRFHV